MRTLTFYKYPIRVLIVFFMVFALQHVSRRTWEQFKSFKSDGVVGFENENNRPFFKTPFYRLVSLGNTQTLVDWYLIRTMGDNERQWLSSDVRSVVYNFYDLMLDLDPYFFDLYFAGANYLTVVKNDNVGALSLSQRGRIFYETENAYWPEKFKSDFWGEYWKMNLVEGYLQLFEFQNPLGAMEAYQSLAYVESLPLGLKRILKKIQTAEGRLEMAFNSVRSMLESSREDLNKERLLGFQKQLQMSRYLLLANRLWRNYRSINHVTDSYAAQLKVWENFKATTGLPPVDPMGGKPYIRSDGKIWTTSDWRPVVNEDVEF